MAAKGKWLTISAEQEEALVSKIIEQKLSENINKLTIKS